MAADSADPEAKAPINAFARSTTVTGLNVVPSAGVVGALLCQVIHLGFGVKYPAQKLHCLNCCFCALYIFLKGFLRGFLGEHEMK